ncbi:MAG TPA: OmpA family protein, partial [Terriglobales bacterium]|nr:OmpA family protein [Terriglobales bacterium]
MRIRGFFGRNLLTWLLLVTGAAAQGYKPDDPIPPGAKGTVLPIQGNVVEIKGLSSGVTGGASGIQSVLQDLGAKVTEMEVRIDLAADVLFDFDKAALKPEATDALRKVGQVVAAYPNAPMLIEGHTDGKGKHAYNMGLSERRAQSVKSWLVQNASIEAARITTRGWGETKPVAP